MDNEELARKLKELKDENDKRRVMRLPLLRQERYQNVGDYDAALRAHCRLDAEG